MFDVLEVAYFSLGNAIWLRLAGGTNLDPTGYIGPAHSTVRATPQGRWQRVLSSFAEDATVHPISAFLDIVDALSTTGWSISPGFVPDTDIERLRETELALWQEGAFRAAGIGAGAAINRPEIRSDRIHWLDPGALPEAVVPYWARLDALREELNRTLYLGLRGFEGHFAVYPAGAFYKRHIDQFKTAPHRMVSCILYLNSDWTPEDGGLLRIYPPDAIDDAGIDVVPHAGTFVCFLSDRIPHEVLPARRERLSLTGWMHRK